MDDTHGRDRRIALATVALVHLLLGWLVVRAGRVAVPDASGAVADAALQVVWITPSPPAAPARPPTPIATASSKPPRPRAAIRPAAAASAPAIDTATAPEVAATAESQAPLSATFIDPDPHAAPPPGGGDFAPSPLRDRIVALPGRPASRFRMRDPVTPATVVESVGRLFGGGPSDPCPRLRESIAALATDGDSAALREATERRRSHCP